MKLRTFDKMNASIKTYYHVACQIIMEQYYDNLNALYAKRGTCKNAAAYGVRYPFHLHAERMS